MIRTQREYEEQRRQVSDYQHVAAEQRRALEASGLAPDEVERGMEPVLGFIAQLEDDLRLYERIRERDFAPLHAFAHVGQLLIALRIANGLTQRELAGRLGIHESQVSRDERNEYYGITVERATEVMAALGEQVSVRVEARPPRQTEPTLTAA